MNNKSKKALRKSIKKMKRQVQTQKGITLVALVVTIIILIILATVAINFAFGSNGLIRRAEEARDYYANDTKYTDESISNVTAYLNGLISGVEGGDTLPADGSFSEEKGVNTPKLASNMKLVTFNSSDNTWIPDETNSGYSYEEQTGTTEDGGTSEWANAEVTIDGITSYFVWIPRYAYKITYYTNEDKTEISRTPTTYGTIDVKFIKGTGNLAADGATVCKYADDPTLDTTTDYIIHPAFTANADLGGGFGNNNGTNDNGISGIWVGKYEASLANKADGTNIVINSSTDGNILLKTPEHTDKTIVTKPGYSSWRYIDIGKMYTNALAYSTDLQSHMLKNSEWGAVAYLTESQYGRNGTEVTINNNGSTYFTGGGDDNAYVTNANQSSTGNVYGIYDLSGNAWEYLAAAYQNRSEIGTTNGSTKYATVYNGTSANVAYKYGDATHETSRWHSDYASFVNSGDPFFSRGGSYVDAASSTGVFCFHGYSGDADSNNSFRLALVV